MYLTYSEVAFMSCPVSDKSQKQSAPINLAALTLLHLNKIFTLIVVFLLCRRLESFKSSILISEFLFFIFVESSIFILVRPHRKEKDSMGSFVYLGNRIFSDRCPFSNWISTIIESGKHTNGLYDRSNIPYRHLRNI